MDSAAYIGARDFYFFAHVWGGDAFGELVGSLIVILGDLPMPFFVLHHVRTYARGRPDGDVELQRKLDLRDGDERMRRIGLLRLRSHAGIG